MCGLLNTGSAGALARSANARHGFDQEEGQQKHQAFRAARSHAGEGARAPGKTEPRIPKVQHYPSTPSGRRLFSESARPGRKNKKMPRPFIAAFSSLVRREALGSISVGIPAHEALAVDLSEITEPGLFKVVRPLRVVSATILGVALSRLYPVFIPLVIGGL